VQEQGRSKEGIARRRKGTCLPHLKVIRRNRHLTQERLSALSGVSRESIYRLEGDKRGAMPDTMWKLALALGVRPEELVHGERHTWWRYLGASKGRSSPTRSPGPCLQASTIPSRHRVQSHCSTWPKQRDRRVSSIECFTLTRPKLSILWSRLSGPCSPLGARSSLLSASSGARRTSPRR
jgi:DNA-binding XRE family transcriptional regulator